MPVSTMECPPSMRAPASCSAWLPPSRIVRSTSSDSSPVGKATMLSAEKGVPPIA
jgi:hypothetical protein